jgi:hypothetical protein
MKSTRPLAKTGNEVERLLLAAGAGERPDAESVRKTARALGLAPRAALVAATLGIALRASKWTSIAAWSSVSLVGVAVLVVTAHAGRSVPVTGVELTARPQVQAYVSHALPASPASLGIDEDRAPIALDEARAPSPPRETRGAAHHGGPIVPAAADRLRDEARAIDSARALLALGDASGALARLSDYDRRFAGGSLREEALLLRIESLVRVGDRSTAAGLARRFVTAYPASVHVERVEAVLRELTVPRAP